MPQGEETEVKNVADMTAAELDAHVASEDARFKEESKKRLTAHRLAQSDLKALARVRKNREAAAA